MKKILKIIVWIVGVIVVLSVGIMFVCEQLVESGANRNASSGNDSIIIIEPLDTSFLKCASNVSNFWREINTIDGHREMDTIVGNFTGNSIDTLYVDTDTTKSDGEKWQFFARSSNPKIPLFSLWGFSNASPKLVNEGDLDGNGTCEVGYLHTWMNSQWRYYRILTLVNGQWRYLVEGDYLETPEWFRHSGSEIAERSNHSGKVLIHYAFDGVNEAGTERLLEIKDTIVEPTFSKIDD
jgi:hypothetical protein